MGICVMGDFIYHYARCITRQIPISLHRNCLSEKTARAGPGRDKRSRAGRRRSKRIQKKGELPHYYSGYHCTLWVGWRRQEDKLSAPVCCSWIVFLCVF